MTTTAIKTTKTTKPAKKFKYPFGPGITKWVEKPNPKNSVKSSNDEGWFGELDKTFLQTNPDQSYVALIRNFEHPQFGRVIHCAVRNTFGTDIPWSEKQRIKNEIFSNETNAIEFYPPESKLIDFAPMYHLWITLDFEFPFGLHSSQDNS